MFHGKKKTWGPCTRWAPNRSLYCKRSEFTPINSHKWPYQFVSGFFNRGWFSPPLSGVSFHHFHSPTSSEILEAPLQPCSDDSNGLQPPANLKGKLVILILKTGCIFWRLPFFFRWLLLLGFSWGGSNGGLKHTVTRWWQLKHVFLFSPRTLGKMNPLWLILFNWVETATLLSVVFSHLSRWWCQFVCVFFWLYNLIIPPGK